MTERWAWVPGWVGYYEVSDAGRVRAVERIVPTKTGLRVYADRMLSARGRYPHVTLRGPQRRRAQVAVHRLVLSAFVGPCPAGMEGCHNDGDPSNNRLSNLRYDTRAGNFGDKRAHGTHLAGERHPNARLTAGAVARIRASSASAKALAAQFSTTATNVRLIRRNRSWVNTNG